MVRVPSLNQRRVVASQGYVRSIALVGFDDWVRGVGGDPIALLEEAGISPDALNDLETPIPFHCLNTLREISAGRLGRPDAGIEIAEHVMAHMVHAGTGMMLMCFVDTAGQWLQLGLRYWRQQTDAYTITLMVADGTDDAVLRLEVHSITPAGRQFNEFVIARLALVVTRHMGLPSSTIRIARFQHARPASTERHQQLFGCPIEFSSDHTELVIDRRALGHRINGGVKRFRSLVRAAVQWRASRLQGDHGSVSATVSLAILSMLGTGRCNLENIAESMDLAPKRLQRILDGEGTSFSTLLDGTRRTMALRMLHDTDGSMERIAAMLDYAGNAPFTVAFRRWTGTTPQEFRRCERDRAGDSDAGGKHSGA